MSIPKQSRPIMFGNKNQEIDIPDFLKKPQETRVTITEPALQESIRQEYRKGIIIGWIHGFLAGNIVPLILVMVLMTLGII